MKHIYVLFAVSVICMASCGGEKEWPESNVESAQVYSLSDFTGYSGSQAFDIYLEDPILIEFASNQVFKYLPFNFEDMSEVKYEISAGDTTDVYYDYNITASYDRSQDVIVKDAFGQILDVDSVNYRTLKLIITRSGEAEGESFEEVQVELEAQSFVYGRDTIESSSEMVSFTAIAEKTNRYR
ncbi:hypothetical protein [Reichenbachiella versicolor]|uniref:hypothetical protein n=1 Tax=Reichenbachiella versicolor TaxID=1821036 RepID=UPI0013A58845|nr:hypothetical protein [Reichenbachiella versicolor]